MNSEGDNFTTVTQNLSEISLTLSGEDWLAGAYLKDCTLLDKRHYYFRKMMRPIS